MNEKARKKYHHGNLRSALIEAAIPVLRSKGVAGLSLRELAAQLSVSHGAPYRHFKNKTELLEAIAVEGYEQLVENATAACQKYPDDPKRQLFETGIGYILYVSQHKEIADLMFSGALPINNCGAELKNVSDQAVNSLVRIIENGKKAGIYGEKDTMALTLTSLSTVHGLSMLISAGFMGDEISNEKLREISIKAYTTLMEGMLESEQC